MQFVRADSVTSRPGSPDKFTDGVWRADTLPGVKEGGMTALRLAYRPGARSAWHTHAGEQALFVLSGRGVVTRWGEAKGTEVGPGDWVHIEPGEKHWHGARPDDTFVHVAVTATGGTEWHGHVSDDDYHRSVDEG